jgi:hypothetical protein
VLLPLLALGASAILTALAARQFTVYLVDGGLAHAGISIAALGGALLLVVAAVWWASGHNGAAVWRSAGDLLFAAGPMAFLTTVVAAWVIGILGLCGVGVVEPGVLTIAGSVVLVAATLSERPWEQDALVEPAYSGAGPQENVARPTPDTPGPRWRKRKRRRFARDTSADKRPT